jgi:hypothetical protein
VRQARLNGHETRHLNDVAVQNAIDIAAPAETVFDFVVDA